MNIIYISHTSQKFYDQTRFSILTLLHLLVQKNDRAIQIIVYTDAPESVPSHPFISIKKISRDVIKGYKGPFHFVHRVKLEVLRDESRKNTEPFLFVDSDTRWLSYPEHLVQVMHSKEAASSPTCYLHVRESDNLANISDQYNTMYENFGPTLQSLGVKLEQPFQMWNTGAVGVNQGATAFFEKALKLTDFLIPRVLPTYWLEQTALSMIAMSHYQVTPLTEKILHHYWNYSFEAPFYLKQIFQEMSATKKLGPSSLEEQAKFCFEYNWDNEVLSALSRKLKQQRRYAKWRNSPMKFFHKTHIKLHQLLLKMRGKYTTNNPKNN
jgi:hypothetical protein